MVVSVLLTVSVLCRHDLKAGILQEPNDDLGRPFGIKDLVVKFGGTEKINENVAGC